MKSKKNRLSAIVTNAILLVMLSALCFVSITAGNSAFAVARKTNAPYYKGNQTRGEVSLMINVYWGTEYLQGMLDTLDRYGAKCTFFIGGSWADDNNDLIGQMVDRGHELGNHGYFHKDHKGMSLEKNLAEIKPTNTLLQAMTGKKITLFAPPSGSFDTTTLSAAEQLGMKVIMWSRDTIDWRDKDADVVYKRATAKTQAGDLILMHPTAHTAQALPRILQTLQEKGLKAVTVSQMIDETV